jgi:glyoxalase family protein
MKLEGIHHVTCVTADAPSNADFYVRVLGLRIVKKTINQTDMTTYHIFYGDEQASYGNNISFFEYRGRPDGRAGAGNVHRIVWRVGSDEALGFWERRLAGEGIEGERSEAGLRFADHEGLDHELAVVGTPDEPLTGEAPDIPAEFALQGLDGFRAYATDADASERFVTARLGFTDFGDGRLEARGAERGGWYALDPAPPEKRRFGGGVVQHVAWGCRPEDIEEWHSLLAREGVEPTEVIDRHFFRSVYFTEPGGVLFEIAERGGPGFIVDEPDAEHMGDDLRLPPWLEDRRKLYEYSLTPVPTTAEIRAGAAAPPAAARAAAPVT